MVIKLLEKERQNLKNKIEKSKGFRVEMIENLRFCFLQCKTFYAFLMFATIENSTMHFVNLRGEKFI